MTITLRSSVAAKKRMHCARADGTSRRSTCAVELPRWKTGEEDRRPIQRKALYPLQTKVEDGGSVIFV